MADDKKPKELVPINPAVAKLLGMFTTSNVESLKQNIENLTGLQDAYARYVGARFKALLKEGFTREEAMRLCEKM